MRAKVFHRHGGTITAITHVGHDTDRGVASWFFVGDIEWDDGSRSAAREIPPWAVCCDGADSEGTAEVNRLLQHLADYLERAGAMHKQKSKRDGRVYSWTPHQPANREPIPGVAS